MLSTVLNTIVLLSEAGKSGGFLDFYNKWLNIPGFEVWKFLNLAIFIGALTYVLRKPLGDAFKAKRDAIRQDLIKAEEEKKAALAKLTAVESKLASLDAETQLVLLKAKEEADEETGRIAKEADEEAGKIRVQTDSEIVRLTKQTQNELKRFSAEESIRLAEEKLKARVDANADAGLVRTGIAAIGGMGK